MKTQKLYTSQIVTMGAELARMLARDMGMQDMSEVLSTTPLDLATTWRDFLSGIQSRTYTVPQGRIRIHSVVLLGPDREDGDGVWINGTINHDFDELIRVKCERVIDGEAWVKKSPDTRYADSWQRQDGRITILVREFSRPLLESPCSK